MDSRKTVKLPRDVWYLSPEQARALLSTINDDAAVGDNGRASDTDELLVERIRSRVATANAEKKRKKEGEHMEPPVAQFTPLRSKVVILGHISLALVNAAGLGFMVYLLAGPIWGLLAGLGALGGWIGSILYFAGRFASESLPGHYNGPRTRTGEDAERILERFRRGEEL